MGYTVALVWDVMRLEERMILEALRGRFRVELVDAKSAPLEFGGEGPEAALIRPISMYRALYSAAALESRGAFTVNSSTTLAVAGDKLLAYSRLTAAGIPVPRTLYASTPEAALEAAGRLGYPVVVKPPVGSWGRLVVRARDPGFLESVAAHRLEMPCSQLQAMIVQEHVDTGGSDIRCITVAGETVGCVRRVAGRGEWRSNVALGARTEPLRVDGELAELAVKAAGAVGGFFVSIDIFEDKRRGYLVNEVNGVPEFKGFYSATGLNPAVRLAEALAGVLRR